MALSSILSVSVSADQTSAGDLATGSVPLAVRKALVLADGTGDGQADLVFHDRRTLAASATEDLDLAGALTDAFGNTLTFARVKGLYVAAADANPENVEVGGAGTNGFATPFGDPTDVVIVRPGGFFAVGASDATAYAVTAGTGDLLTVTNGGSGGSVTYDVVVVGASA